METTKKCMEGAGRMTGQGYRYITKKAKKDDWSGKTSTTASAVGEQYEKSTGRKAGRDAKIAAVVGAGVVGVTAAAAATQAVVTGACVAAVGVGAAAVAKYNGYDKEVNAVGRGCAKAYKVVKECTKSLVTGFKDGARDGEQVALEDDEAGTSQKPLPPSMPPSVQYPKLPPSAPPS